MGHWQRQQPRTKGWKLLQRGRTAFNVRKNLLIELLKNGGGELFLPESPELEILKKLSFKDVLEFRGAFYTRLKAVLDARVILVILSFSMIYVVLSFDVCNSIIL